jgi:hypothetical protein
MYSRWLFIIWLDITFSHPLGCLFSVSIHTFLIFMNSNFCFNMCFWCATQETTVQSNLLSVLQFHIFNQSQLIFKYGIQSKGPTPFFYMSILSFPNTIWRDSPLSIEWSWYTCYKSFEWIYGDLFLGSLF